ncbi:MAG TPA: hypothetical protein PKY82_21730 [Pyrinomonadaceae bacterium]|nr:hypothetical protein [Pyrinomonadaceae bacterium]
MKKMSLYIIALFILVTGVFSLSAFAQDEKLIGIGKTGKFHLDSPLRVGDKLLKPGMYQVQHQTENNEHFIILREIEMNRFGHPMSNEKLVGEVARFKCTIEPVEKENKNAKILVRRNAGNEREFVEVWFKGEKIKHVLPKK